MPKQFPLNPEPFFDQLAPTYRKRFSHPFLGYYFNERLNAATIGFDPNGKTILDVGTGTGALYDFLKAQNTSFEFWGSDISSRMLEESSIPPDRQLHGNIAEVLPADFQADAIFMLGVTTYLSKQELSDHLKLFHSILVENGKVVLSFTHRPSLDFRLRQLVKMFTPKKWRVGKVLSLPVSAYSRSEAISLMQDFSLLEVLWLNQTIPPFNRRFPKISIQFARFLKKNLPAFLLPVFSSDFLLVLGKATGPTT